MSCFDLEGKTHEELLRVVLTGDAITSHEETHEADTIEAMIRASEDLDAIWQALETDKAMTDLGGIIMRIQMRLEVAAELARRELDTKRKAPAPRRVFPIGRDKSPFTGGPDT